MPAVRIFSLYASLAVLIDFLLQITCFVSLLTLDSRRELARRFNLFCCIRATSSQETFSFSNTNYDRSVSKNSTNATLITTSETNSSIAQPMNSIDIDMTRESDEQDSGLLYGVFKRFYAPLVLHKSVRPVVILLFAALFCASMSMAPHVSVGLNQKLSMPTDSYVLDYFEALEKYLSVGVPVYFVVKSGHNYATVDGQNEICATSGCYSDSLLNQISLATFNPNETHLGIPANSWIDDYFDWLSSGDCCSVYLNDTNKFCPSSVNRSLCLACPVGFVPDTNRPNVTEFYRYLDFYMGDNPNTKCAKGGHAAYGAAIERIEENRAGGEIGATFYMAYHTVGVTSADFIEALRHGNLIAENVTRSMRERAKERNPNITKEALEDVEVFAYSVFYVFYDQYITIWRDGLMNLSVSVLAIFLVTIVLLGFDFYTGFIITLTIGMIIVNMFAAMFLLGIELNAVSLVNLVMAVGISVEFVAHTARDFAISIKGSRVERAKHALTSMGSSVFSGITLTKILGIIVLAFAHSQLFQVFYFRMYLSVVIIGASHGLIFLPVLLSYIGPSLNKLRYFDYLNKRMSPSGEQI